VEKLSRLMDGDLSEQELRSVVRACAARSEERDAWASYHLIGECLRGEAPNAGAHSALTARICAALDEEPNVLVPAVVQAKRDRAERDERAGESAPIVVNGVQHFAWKPWAMAASMAAAGVIGWQGLSSGWRSETAGNAVAASARTDVTPVVMAQTAAPAMTASSASLERYMRAHADVAPPTRLSSPQVYVQTVAASHTH
jgi:sigma-E factor negative regulatory protein RseA